MKNTTTLAFLLITLTIVGCTNSKKNVDPIIDNSFGLPNATQEGKNTLGFLLNGQPWTPKGQVGVSANLTINVDFGYNKGIFTISAYRTSSNNVTEYFGFGLRDSLNYLNFPMSLQLNKNSLYGIRFANQCTYYSTDNGIFSSGVLTISKLDKTSQIISGSFNATIYKPSCDTIKITEGRFDMKY